MKLCRYVLQNYATVAEVSPMNCKVDDWNTLHDQQKRLIETTQFRCIGNAVSMIASPQDFGIAEAKDMNDTNAWKS